MTVHYLLLLLIRSVYCIFNFYICTYIIRNNLDLTHWLGIPKVIVQSPLAHLVRLRDVFKKYLVPKGTIVNWAKWKPNPLQYLTFLDNMAKNIFFSSCLTDIRDICSNCIRYLFFQRLPHSCTYWRSEFW